MTGTSTFKFNAVPNGVSDPRHSPTMHPLLVDAPSSSYYPWTLRRDRQQLGRSIGRQRLVKNRGGHYPKHILHSSHTDPSASSAAIICVHFLSNDVILSAQSHGQMAVHRLPVGTGPSGKVHKIMDLPPLQEQTTILKLFPLSDATSFAVGLPNGDYRIYSGEGAKWSSSLYSSTTACTPLRTPSAPFYTTVDQIHGVRRRYHRDFVSSLWVSRDVRSTTPTWSEISDWETKRYITRPNSYHWISNAECLPGHYPSAAHVQPPRTRRLTKFTR